MPLTTVSPITSASTAARISSAASSWLSHAARLRAVARSPTGGGWAEEPDRRAAAAAPAGGAPAGAARRAAGRGRAIWVRGPRGALAPPLKRVGVRRHGLLAGGEHQPRNRA